ncbi:histone-lysine N-methyltransferase PRDM9 [Triplophysa rosa]|uniref:Histone-lysine N-methyltransferase PRDM9 n=1 Tax=Triplophysa rosa TaxID=992332 RepID=A0A9W7T9L2_TRIRA|nr:histone-lysine N-methyltransferase PRDM9 [Triplophysa rosa]
MYIKDACQQNLYLPVQPLQHHGPDQIGFKGCQRQDWRPAQTLNRLQTEAWSSCPRRPAWLVLNCEECQSFFIGECDVHGAPLFIPDTFVSVGAADRARLTLPAGLEVRTSNIPNAGLGVFNQGEILPVGAHFGPYEAEASKKEEAISSGYSFVIYKRKHLIEYIDARRETHSNWMRYVNCALSEEEQNLVAFQYEGAILYRCCRTIKTGEELLVWYGEEYARGFDITFDHLWNTKCSDRGMKNYFFGEIFKYTSVSHVHIVKEDTGVKCRVSRFNQKLPHSQIKTAENSS